MISSLKCSVTEGCTYGGGGGGGVFRKVSQKNAGKWGHGLKNYFPKMPKKDKKTHPFRKKNNFTK